MNDEDIFRREEKEPFITEKDKEDFRSFLQQFKKKPDSEPKFTKQDLRDAFEAGEDRDETFQEWYESRFGS